MNNHSSEAAINCVLAPSLIIFLGDSLFLKIEEVKNDPNIRPHELAMNTKLKCVLDSPPTSITRTGELEI